MACKHKFYDSLRLEKLDFSPKTLMIGTFNPEWPADNNALWFYGRTRNNYFWDVLPRMFKEDSLRNEESPKDWKNFCLRNKVAITDLIASINDAKEQDPIHNELISRFLDKEFANTFSQFERTGVLDLIKKYSSIKAVYYTRQEGVELFDTEINLIKKYCEQKGIYFSNLLTPSGSARFQMREYEPEDKSLKRTLANFIYEKWREKWSFR